MERSSRRDESTVDEDERMENDYADDDKDNDDNDDDSEQENRFGEGLEPAYRSASSNLENGWCGSTGMVDSFKIAR